MEREKVMTVQEYIDKNLPFYHITPIEYEYDILEQGLLRSKGQVKAICTVRSDDEDIWHHIAETQLSNGGIYKEFIVFKLLPKKHSIEVANVAPDTIEEETTPLHNYIVKDIKIEKEDIVKSFSIKSRYSNMIDKSKIKHLTGYQIEGLPRISKKLKELLGEA